MPRARTPRDRWIEEGLTLLVEGGPDAVRVEVLATRIGVTKGGFYGHFSDRQALLDAMLDRWRTDSVDEVLAAVERVGGAPADRAVLAGHLTFDDERLPTDMAVREWARRDSGVAERLREVDNRRMELLRTSFAGNGVEGVELEARCLIAFCVAIGSRLLDADHPGFTRRQVLDAATELVIDPVNATRAR
ncbi:TetR/AcrR family transcriptional regulator [Rhodococcoides fascians A25f]|uniref:TetR/AcrR family transcriptional regulator n=1 Tax=Rhodococcoides fascians TaxID=1828 RepID=UPI000559D7F3|nr:TetR/AcrR family transcriptional regulator [Rhodococcus fascians]QII06910.1 TetR/AcrR family transcriptional regulator [Rhodococcus fascians A25f]